MKQIVLLTLIVGLFALAGRAVAAPATPSATPMQNAKQIEDLKERLATKVAELRQTQRRAIFGTVKSVSISTVTIETKTKDVKIELTDEVKVVQYLKGVRTKLTAADLEKGDQVVVFGDYDGTLDILKASVIFIQSTLPFRIAGTVTDVNKTEYTITVKTSDGQSYVVDMETATKTVLWNTTGGIQKGKFSTIAVGDIVHVAGVGTPKNNRFSADRVLDIGNLTGAAPAPTATSAVTPSPSAKPTTTPTSTPAPTPKKTPTPTP